MFLAHNAAMRALLRLAPVLASLLACTSSPATPPVDASPPTDLANDLGAADAPGDDAADVPAPPPWPHVLAPARVMGEARGLRATRAIIHAHSVHSHDACDGNPYVDGDEVQASSEARTGARRSRRRIAPLCARSVPCGNGAQRALTTGCTQRAARLDT